MSKGNNPYSVSILSKTKIAIILFLLNSFSIAQEIEGEIPETFLALNLPRTSHTIQESGFSIIFNSPGFMSMLLSEINFAYKDLNYNSYSIGFGASYLLLGLNKRLIGLDKGCLYGNISFGLFRSWTGNWYNLGSLGVSYLLKSKKMHTSFEFGIDGFFHHGQGGSGDFIPGKLSNFNMRGVIGNITISKSISKTFIFSFSIGLSYSSFQYVNYNYPYKEGSYYTFVSKEASNNKKNYNGKPKWEDYWLMPLGITISYHF